MFDLSQIMEKDLLYVHSYSLTTRSCTFPSRRVGLRCNILRPTDVMLAGDR